MNIHLNQVNSDVWKSERGRDLKRGEGARVQHNEAHTRSTDEGQVPEDALLACHHPTEGLVHDSPLSFPAS